jgi:hypothetical protein
MAKTGKSAKSRASQGGGKSAESGSQKELLAKELKNLIKKIDIEGLVFLLKQAHVIIHNQEVDRINQEMSKLTDVSKQAREKKAHTRVPYPVDIEEGAGAKHFVLVVAGKRKMMARDEMRKLVAICQAARDMGQACGRMFNWLKANRSDVLLDTGITNARSTTLASVYNIIKKRYKVKS